MRRRRGVSPTAHSFLPWQKRHSAPFSLRGKEKAAGGKKKTANGEFRISPFANPLKTTKKGAAAPFLGLSPEFGLCGDRLRLAKRATDASLIDRRGSRNTLRLFRMYLARKSVCARYVWLPLQKRRLFDFYTSNIQRAQTKRFVRRIVRLGNPISRPPEGRSLRDAPSVNGIQKQNVFSGASALFRTPAPLFSPFFSGKTEKNGPSETTCAFGASEMGLRRRKEWASGAKKHVFGVQNKKTVAGQAYDGWQGMRDSNRNTC